MSDLSHFYGPNAGYVLDLYERYLQDPESLDPAARAFFADFHAESPTTLTGERSSARRLESLQTDGKVCSSVDVDRIVRAARLGRLIREVGHLAARVDPLGSPPPGDPGLKPATHGLHARDLTMLPASVVGGPLAEQSQDALEAIAKLRKVYSGSVGYEDDHVQDAEERTWLRDAIETERFFQGFTPEWKHEMLERLTEVETFERYIHQTFPGVKRFSIEGTDMLVPMLDEIVHCAASAGAREVVMGMAHRGRLNVLAHILGKPYSAILAEFDNTKREDSTSVAGRGTYGWTGDVKYHLGERRAYKESGFEEMPLTLVPNPSHLEFVNPVVEGHARAAQERRDQPGTPLHDETAALAILIHGDAAFPGQGVVAETLNLSRLKGYRTGGTIHIIVNNQIGYTTLPKDDRSTLYAGDLAKGFEIPIVHVNADDPEACIAVARMAHAYRERFHKDFLVDLIGYRRYGHNEGDEPAFTQPRMYEIIESHPTVREKLASEMEKQGLLTGDEAADTVSVVKERLRASQTLTKDAKATSAPHPARTPRPQIIKTAVPESRLIELNEMLLTLPEGFTPHPRLDRTVLQKRREALKGEGLIDWGHAETLAFASILADGTPIRLTGQDTERGTFSHRHLVLHDVETDACYVPMQELPAARASFAVYNSPLSENAALGFEYGYSIHAPGVLVLWEAQFGDFANGAQVILDQFVISGGAKWQHIPSLTLLLPHGYEGQGPEHSSARLERFLQLAANDNMYVVNCTTAAQYFHLLRRQAALLEIEPRPLVVMSPKSLLRHKNASSSLSDLAHGRFQTVIDDAAARDHADRITRLILCSGKVYVDLVNEATFPSAERVAVARIEQLYPFPAEEIQQVIAGYPNLQEIVWLQEEPANMGAWMFVAPRLKELVGWAGELTYVGRTEAASPAEGSVRHHQVIQARLLASALRGVPLLREERISTAAPVSRGEISHVK